MHKKIDSLKQFASDKWILNTGRGIFFRFRPFFLLLIVFFSVAQAVFAQRTPDQSGGLQVGWVDLGFNDSIYAPPPHQLFARVYYPATVAGENQPIATETYPLIVFAPDKGSNFLTYRQIANHLSSWGYIVAVVDAETYLKKIDGTTYARLINSTLTFLTKENGREKSKLYRKLNGRVASAGHGFGGQAAVEAAATNSLIQASSALAPALESEALQQALPAFKTPLQIICGDREEVYPEQTHARNLYLAAQGAKQWISLRGGVHCQFTDRASFCHAPRTPEILNGERQLQMTFQYQTAFFNYVLKDDPAARPYVCGKMIENDNLGNYLSYKTTYECPNCDNLFAFIKFDGEPVICPGDSIRLYMKRPFRAYKWSNGATTPYIWVKQAGSFSVTVVNEQGCPVNATPVVVTQRPTPPLGIKSDSEWMICEDNPVHLQASDGFIKYDWATGDRTRTIAVNKPGVYRLKATAPNGCVLSDSAVVTATAPVSLTLHATPISCFGKKDGSIYARPLGGSGRYQFSVNGGAFQPNATFGDLAPGRYTILVKDKTGCRAESMAEIMEPNPNCAAPALLTTNNIKPYSAQIKWQAANCVKGYSVAWRQAGQTDWFLEKTLKNEYALDSLLQGAVYEWTVRVECETGKGRFAPPQVFMTGGCPIANHLTVTRVTDQTAELNWQAESGAFQFIVAYRALGVPDSAMKFMAAVSPKTTLKNLKPGQTYEWRVRARCSNNAEGVYGYPSYFKTQGQAAPQKPLPQQITESVTQQPNKPSATPKALAQDTATAKKGVWMEFDADQKILFLHLEAKPAAYDTMAFLTITDRDKKIIYEEPVWQLADNEIVPIKLRAITDGNYTAEYLYKNRRIRYFFLFKAWD